MLNICLQLHITVKLLQTTAFFIISAIVLASSLAIIDHLKPPEQLENLLLKVN